MIDVISQKPISVFTGAGLASYIRVPFEQLNTVTALLDANQLSYWVDEEVLSIDDKPEVAFINLARRTDPRVVQQLLDRIP